MAGGRRDDHYPEYRIGRIKHERIKVGLRHDYYFPSFLKNLKICG